MFVPSFKHLINGALCMATSLMKDTLVVPNSLSLSAVRRGFCYLKFVQLRSLRLCRIHFYIINNCFDTYTHQT